MAKHRGRFVAGAAFLLVALIPWVGAGCGATHAAWVPSHARSSALPAGGADLVALADKELREGAGDPSRIDRALAALEAAKGKEGAAPFEVSWRSARACFELTEILDGTPMAEAYSARGIAYAKEASEGVSERVEGHYYLALNMVKAVAASSDLEALAPMLEVAKRAAEIAPDYDEAGPLRLIGKVYMVAPEWPTSVGDRDKAVEVLKKAVSLAATPMNRLFLGQAFFHIDEFDRAVPHVRRALKQGLKEGLEERWLDEARDYLRRMGASE